MIFEIDATMIISTVGVLGVALLVFAESGLALGFFLPGEVVLFTVGLLVSENIVHFNIYLLVAIIFIAAVAGDNVGYAFGHKWGVKLFERKNSRIFSQSNKERVVSFYKKHGSKAVLLARFVPVVRTFAPIVAGMSNMNYGVFLLFNIIGALLWGAGVTCLGYYAGQWLIENFAVNRVFIWGILIVVAFFVHIIVSKVKKKKNDIHRGPDL